VGKKFKTKQKKKDDMPFLPTALPTEFSVGIFQRVLFGGFLKKFN
jgi:hypothetical protein